MTTPFKCPDCGSPLDLQTDAETEDLVFLKATRTVESVRRKAIVAFCTGCEFCVEVVPPPYEVRKQLREATLAVGRTS